MHFKAPNHIHIFERIQFTELVQNAGLTIHSPRAIWLLLEHLDDALLGLYRRLAKMPKKQLMKIWNPFHPLLEDWSGLATRHPLARRQSNQTGTGPDSA